MRECSVRAEVLNAEPSGKRDLAAHSSVKAAGVGETKKTRVSYTAVGRSPAHRCSHDTLFSPKILSRSMASSIRSHDSFEACRGAAAELPLPRGCMHERAWKKSAAFLSQLEGGRPMGVEREVLKEGKGRTPRSGEVVLCHYVRQSSLCQSPSRLFSHCRLIFACTP